MPEGRLYRFGLTQVRANPPGERQRDEHDPSYRKYGFEASVMGPFREGAPITWTFHLEDGPLNVENYFLNVEIHEEALHAAGFRDVRWHQPMLSPAGDAGYGRDYWSTLLDHPPVIFIECFLAKS